MAKIGKKRNNPNSVEAYACFCTCPCQCSCYCSVVCPPGGITSSEYQNQVGSYASNSKYYSPLDSIAASITNKVYG